MLVSDCRSVVRPTTLFWGTLDATSVTTFDATLKPIPEPADKLHNTALVPSCPPELTRDVPDPPDVTRAVLFPRTSSRTPALNVELWTQGPEKCMESAA